MKSLAQVFVSLFLVVHLHADEALSCEEQGGACHQAVEHVDIDLDHTVELLQAKLELSDSTQGVAPASKQAKAASPTELSDQHQEVAPASRQAKAADPTGLTDRHQEVAQAAHAAARGHHVAESTLQQNARLASSKMREAKAQRSSGTSTWLIVLMFIAGTWSLLQGLYTLRSNRPTTNEQQAGEQPMDSTSFVARSCKSLFEARTPPPASRGEQTDQPEWAKGMNETFNSPAWALFQILGGLATIGTGVYFLAR